MSSASSSAVNGTRPLRRHISWVQVRVQLVLTSSCCNLGFEKSRSRVIGELVELACFSRALAFYRVLRTKVVCLCQTCEQNRFVTSHGNMAPQITQQLYVLRYATKKIYNGDGGRGSQLLAWSNRDSWLSVTWALHPGGNVWQGQTTFACVANELFYSKHCNFDFIDFKVWPAFRLWRLLIWIFSKGSIL